MAGQFSGKVAARCDCGACELVLTGTAIVTAICYCASCQAAGHAFGARAGGRPVLDGDGGTGYVLQRKDRITPTRGANHLAEYRLKPDSPTRRVIATCCDSPMFLEFSGGHWVSVYRDRLAGDERPPVEMRTMTADRRAGITFSDAIPSYRKHSGRFMWRLLVAWAAMGFRAPKIDYVKGKIDA